MYIILFNMLSEQFLHMSRVDLVLKINRSTSVLPLLCPNLMSVIQSVLKILNIQNLVCRPKGVKNMPLKRGGGAYQMDKTFLKWEIFIIFSIYNTWHTLRNKRMHNTRRIRSLVSCRHASRLHHASGLH